VPEEAEEGEDGPELSDEQKEEMDRALKAAIARKQGETRGRSSHKN
jgi:hypothetical protein